jgi:hypothetical protein
VTFSRMSTSGSNSAGAAMPEKVAKPKMGIAVRRQPGLRHGTCAGPGALSTQ